MSNRDTDKAFAGSIPELYDTYLVPLIFEPYVADLANRLASRSLTRVLEIAAGTGVVTRTLASVLPESVSIVATDLNQPMLDLASAVGTKRPVEWRQADAMKLPFRDGTFDAVVCCGIGSWGSWGARCLSNGDYVMGVGPPDGVTAAGGC